MPNKTVEFLNLKLNSKNGCSLIAINALESIFNTIFDQHSKRTDSCRTLDLTPKVTPDSYEPKILLDIFDIDRPNFLFARISKKKANNAMQHRNYDTYVYKDVFSSEENKKQGIETFTYFIIDYTQGIMSIVNAKDAPGARSLNYIFNEYNTEYELDFINIPNKNGIDLLYKSNSSVITGFEFEVPVPNPEYLQDFLGLDEDELVQIVNENVHKATLILKPEPYKKIENEPSKVRKIIDILQNKRGQYNHSIIRAKTDQISSRNYDLHAKFFTFPITIKQYQTVNGVKRPLSNKDMELQFKDSLFYAYQSNIDLIQCIVNSRENGD